MDDGDQVHTQLIVVIDDGVPYEPCVIGASLVRRASGLMFSIADARNFMCGKRQPFDDFIEDDIEWFEVSR